MVMTATSSRSFVTSADLALFDLCGRVLQQKTVPNTRLCICSRIRTASDGSLLGP